MTLAQETSKAKQTRRTARVPIRLEVELKRSDWSRHYTENISRSGLFVRTTHTLEIGQLVQLRIRLPEPAEPLLLVSKVARRQSPTDALYRGYLPGIGLSFFCPAEDVISHWRTFVQKASDLSTQHPRVSPWDLVSALKNPEKLASAPCPAAELTQTNRAVGSVEVPTIPFRAKDLNRLGKFLSQELASGRFVPPSPVKIGENMPVYLRVIHPETENEFPLAGRTRRSFSDGQVIHFHPVDDRLLAAFEEFILTGRVPLNS